MAEEKPTFADLFPITQQGNLTTPPQMVFGKPQHTRTTRQVSEGMHVHPITQPQYQTPAPAVSPICERHGQLFREEAKKQWTCLGISDPRECWVKLTDEDAIRYELKGEVILR